MNRKTQVPQNRNTVPGADNIADTLKCESCILYDTLFFILSTAKCTFFLSTPYFNRAGNHIFKGCGCTLKVVTGNICLFIRTCWLTQLLLHASDSFHHLVIDETDKL